MQRYLELQMLFLNPWYFQIRNYLEKIIFKIWNKIWKNPFLKYPSLILTFNRPFQAWKIYQNFFFRSEIKYLVNTGICWARRLVYFVRAIDLIFARFIKVGDERILTNERKGIECSDQSRTRLLVSGQSFECSDYLLRFYEAVITSKI